MPTWEADGIQLGTITDEQKRAGGKYLVGGKVEGPGLCHTANYKSWTAGWREHNVGAPELRQRLEPTPQYEFILCMKGSLRYVQKSSCVPAEHECSVQLVPGGYVYASPHVFRAWSLPAQHVTGECVTLSHTNSFHVCPEEVGNIGFGMYFQVWERVTYSVRLFHDCQLHRLIELYQGHIMVGCAGTAQKVEAGNHVYIHPKAKVDIAASLNARGTILYYQGAA